jgi:DNA repair protein RAD50
MTQNREKMENTLDLDYKGIDKQFKEQLIKTKVCPIFLFLLLLPTFLQWSRGGEDADRQVSEFANNDLEKYSKALDNAILKYHSIKMDEINDNIGHLWSKTYQGTGELSLSFLRSRCDTIRVMFWIGEIRKNEECRKER